MVLTILKAAFRDGPSQIISKSFINEPDYEIRLGETGAATQILRPRPKLEPTEIVPVRAIYKGDGGDFSPGLRLN